MTADADILLSRDLIASTVRHSDWAPVEQTMPEGRAKPILAANRIIPFFV